MGHGRRGSAVLGTLMFFGIILVGLALVLWAIAPAPGTVTVTATGQVTGRPDTVSFTIGTHVSASSATQALTQSNTKTAALETALTSHGVKKSEMATSGLDLYTTTNNSGTVTGYAVDDTLDVTLHQIRGVGRIIDAAATAAGNSATLSGISFSISKDSGLLATARTAAMHNAAKMAGELASAGGTGLGSIVRVTDQENGNSGVVFPEAGLTATSGASVPVQAGTQQLSVSVTVTYRLG